MSDPRFARLKTDPRFRKARKQHSKVTVDERFKSVFSGESKKKKLGKSAKVDKYGRAVSATHEQDNLRHFYRLEDGEDDKDIAAEKPTPIDYARGTILLESSDEEEAASYGDSDDEDGTVTLGLNRTRPITVLEDEVEIPLGEEDFADLDAQAEAARAEQEAEDAGKAHVEPTRRLAAVNLDWDHVRSTHLFKIFSSVVTHPASAATSSKSGAGRVSRGRLLSVRVYPSQFGQERMAYEEIHGPPAQVFRKQRELDADEVNESTIFQVGEEGEVDEDALRKYQLERMRYYYAITEFDSVDAAFSVFSELEGTELERSANVFDLSYVPDDMTFEAEPRDEATAETAAYKGLNFVTDALRHSKVKLTWDEDDPERNRMTRRALSKKDLEDEDFSALIASASSGSESDDDARKDPTTERQAARVRMRALLLTDDANDTMPEGWGARVPKANADDVDVEITFTPGLSEHADAVDEETTLEKYQRKLREKRKKRKDEGSEVVAKATKEPKRDKVQDEFFDTEGEAEGAPKRRKQGKREGNTERAQATPARQVSTAEELALLATSDDVAGEPKHFDMKAVLKAEKNKGRHGKRGKKRAMDGEREELQEDFAINVKDDRFQALHEDHTFAIDPTNPQFKKTKSMSALLEEGTKRRKHDVREPTRGDVREAATGNDEDERNLKKLVDSVKRKSSSNGVNGTSAGKRRRI